MTFGQQHSGRGARRAWLVLAAIMLIGFLVRAIEIGRWPLWGDEALTLMIAQRPIGQLFLAAVDPTPGLYYALHKLLLGPMVDAASARAISLVCGTLLIPAAYFLARESRIPALLGAALVALSFPLIDYSQEARAYSLLVLLVTLSAAFFVRWSRQRGPLALFAMLLTCLLAFYTHFASVFWTGPAVLATIWFGRRQVVAPLLLTAIAAVPEMMRIARYPSDGFIWLAQATPVEAAGTLAKALLPFRPAAAWLLLAVLAVGWRAWVHRARVAAWARSNPGAAIAVGILAAAPMLIWMFGLAAGPVFMTRTILIGLPGALLAVALLLKFEPRMARFAVVAASTVSLLFTGTTRVKEDWSEAADRIGSDSVLICQPGEVAAMRHATAGGNRIFLNRRDGTAEMGSAEPWQRSYYEIMSDQRRMDMALKRGRNAEPSLYPVWPVRAARALSQGPVTLSQAVMICQSDEANWTPRYFAD